MSEFFIDCLDMPFVEAWALKDSAFSPANAVLEAWVGMFGHPR